MQLNEKLEKILKDQIVGGSVVLVKGDSIFKYNYGYSSLNDKKKVEDDTIYRIASISKVIIGLAASKLVEDGLLDFDKDISNYLGYKVRNPKFPDVPITTKHLLSHKSSITNGLEDYSIEIGYNGVNGHNYFVSLEDLLTNPNSKYYTDKTYSDYPPGEKYIYSNFGTGIVACIIEKVSGKLFTDFVEEIFFKKLQIDASFKANRIIKKDKISDTYNGFDLCRTAQSYIDGTYPDHPLGNNFRGPAGGLFISMQDLSKIMIALMNDGKYKDVELLKKETVNMYLDMNFLPSRYIEERQVKIQGHTGSAYGVSSLMYFAKEKNTGICFIANGGNYILTPTGLNHIQEAMIDILINNI